MESLIFILLLIPSIGNCLQNRKKADVIGRVVSEISNTKIILLVSRLYS
jgi:hypothetical protein